MQHHSINNRLNKPKFITISFIVITKLKKPMIVNMTTWQARLQQDKNNMSAHAHVFDKWTGWQKLSKRRISNIM